MLTNDDMQQIGKLLDEKLAPIRETLDSHTTVLDRHSQILEIHSKHLESHARTLEAQTKSLASHGKLLRSIKKTVDLTARLLDAEQMRQRKRIERIEVRLGLPPME